MELKEICTKYNVTQTDISRRFGIPLRTVQGWYLGERTPPDYVLKMICKILDNEKEAKGD